MTAEYAHPLLLVLVGPTAAGKSALGVWLAERLGGEIVACDSTQMYRGFNIGTAKPNLVERREIAHHLLDVLGPNEVATAGAYRQRALSVLDDLRQRGRLPVITAGTGLYLRALLEGLADAPARSEELRARLRQSAEENSSGHLHRILRRFDHRAAKRIAPEDEQKLIRAIEVCLLAKRSISEVYRQGRAPLEGWRVVKLGLMPPREALYARIQTRVEVMLQRGWLDEVRGLVQQGLPENAKPFDFIGYRELHAHLNGEATLEAVRTAIVQATRRYAKRQVTWFRREAGVHWLHGFGDTPEIQAQALAWLAQERIAARSVSGGTTAGV